MRQSASARPRVESLALPKVWSKSMSEFVDDVPFNLAFVSVLTTNAPMLPTNVLFSNACEGETCA
jgi:hypothetical protein